jgi:hypothetical protein
VSTYTDEELEVLAEIAADPHPPFWMLVERVERLRGLVAAATERYRQEEAA